MAITVIKQPALFFNSTNPVIFEFTTDSVVGNYDDYLLDVVITSEWRNATATVKNIPPNTATKVFSVNLQDFFKALQLKDFNHEFDKVKNFGIEKFSTSLIIKDGSQPDDDSYLFDEYFFDDFLFTASSNQLDSYTGEFFSMLGTKNVFDSYFNPFNPALNTILAPETIEICNGFNNYISVFQNDRNLNTVQINALFASIPGALGVGTCLLTTSQIASVKGLTQLTVNNQNTAYKCWVLPFIPTSCSSVVQFRFFNKRGGYSFFYSSIDSVNADRSKIEFYNNNYYNEKENISPTIQASSEYKKEISLKGSKNISLLELFDNLLQSPKVEVNLKEVNGNDYFIEVEVTGNLAKQRLSFDYILKLKA